MATIKISDQLGASVDVQLAPKSTLMQTAAALPHLIPTGGEIPKLEVLSLNDPALQSVQIGLAFSEPLDIGGTPLKLSASATASLKLLSQALGSKELFKPDEYGDNLPVPSDVCYMAIGLSLNAAASVRATEGSGAFGFEAAGEIAACSYHPFPLRPPTPRVTEALGQSIGELILPRSSSDLGEMAPGVVVTASSSGSFKFSASANLLTAANPLATVALPSPLPTPAIAESASVAIGASFKITGEFQLRVHKLDSHRVHLGWYRKHGSDFSISASASAGVATSVGSTDLWPTVIAAASSDAAADRAGLAAAQLPSDRIAAIQSAVKSAIDRKLQLSATAEIGALASDEAAFLYEADLSVLDEAGRRVLDGAFGGDLSGLANQDQLPIGITEIRSIWTKVRKSNLSLRINLLGIFNHASVSELAVTGVVTYTPSTGELVIIDQASASSFGITAVNLGPDEEKLRQLMADSFLITAAYRGSLGAIGRPALSSSHVFFRIDDAADSNEMRRYAAIPFALGRSTPDVPADAQFGRTTICAEAIYDDAVSRLLFLKSDGEARNRSEFVDAGRRAIALLVPSDADDAFRRRPATDDELWKRMEDLGPANFEQLLPSTEAAGVRPDYLAIEWWADAMSGAAEILAKLDAPAIEGKPVANDAAFQDLRNDLAKHLKDVASKTHAQFGSPWGLVAMFLVSGMNAKAAVNIIAPHFVYSTSQTMSAVG